MKNAPTEPGIYWATKDHASAWNYVIHVKGKVPFLSYDLWCLEYPDRESKNGTNVLGLSQSVFLFGDKIEFTSHPSDEYKVDKPGLYEVSNDRIKKLACLVGTYPYLSCWLWDIDTNIKTQHHTPWDIYFIKYIKNPGDVH